MKRLIRRAVSQLKENALLRRSVIRLRAISANPQVAALGHAGQLMEAGNFNTAASYLEKIEAKNLRLWKALLNCYLTAHRFEELFAAYERLPEEIKSDFGCRYFYLLAAANLRRTDVVEKVIQAVLAEADSDEASSFLCQIYLFSENLDSEARQKVTERIVSHASWLAVEQFDALLKCAHHFFAKGADADALRLASALRSAAVNDRHRMKLNILDAQVHFLNGRYSLQLSSLNEVLARQGLSPLALLDTGAPVSCENLIAAQAEHQVTDGPLVSILMPAYNSSETITYALESLRGQTYRNIQVIVVDDASSDQTAEIAARFAALDPRFRLVTLEKNAGAFVARNIALGVATGEFVTNQDADDWAHPQKIAVAVAELHRNPEIIATWVEHVRCSRTRGFRALNGYIRPDASSLMFRRESVLQNMGWYDSVRAAGDGEFHLRMERTFGHQSIRQLSKLLSFVNWSETSLSGGGDYQIDSELGIYSQARSAYRRSFGHWHETMDRLYVPFPLITRPFPAPENLVSLKPS